MPYNKGDFTQQGVAGYVNGGLLLNNKRDVTTRISTDEESAGIDSVDIKIKDRLNDIEYHITGENLTEGENVIGGGGGVDINNPTLTINYHQNGYTEPVPFGRVFKLEESTGYITLKDGYLTKNQILLDGEDGQIKLYMIGNDVELIFNSSITNITATDEINCELWSEGIVSGITVENSQENASISISYTLTGLG